MLVILVLDKSSLLFYFIVKDIFCFLFYLSLGIRCRCDYVIKKEKERIIEKEGIY